jgi:hypothetical protein
MKPPFNHNPLLDDVLTEGAEFRNELLERTLEQVRRSKRVRQLNQTLLAASVSVGLLLMVWKAYFPSSHSARSELPALDVVTSHPVAPSMIVETEIGAISLISSSDADLAVVHSQFGEGLFLEINDQELLALFAGRPVALVREAPGRAELLFLDPEDAQGFPVQ